MKRMMKILTTLCLLFISCIVNAHNPDHSSTLLVEQDGNKWVLQVRSALTAFEYEIHEHYGESSYTTPEEFQELVVKHMRKNTSVLFNGGAKVDLQNGQVKLGHETSVTFEMVNAPGSIESVVVKNNSFRDLHNSQSALMVIKKGFSKNQFVLNKSNNHTAKLKVNNAKFELDTSIANTSQAATSTEGNILYPLLIVGLICMVFVILFFVFKNKKTKKISEFSSHT